MPALSSRLNSTFNEVDMNKAFPGSVGLGPSVKLENCCYIVLLQPTNSQHTHVWIRFSTFVFGRNKQIKQNSVNTEDLFYQDISSCNCEWKKFPNWTWKKYGHMATWATGIFQTKTWPQPDAKGFKLVVMASSFKQVWQLAWMDIRLKASICIFEHILMQLVLMTISLIDSTCRHFPW